MDNPTISGIYPFSYPALTTSSITVFSRTTVPDGIFCCNTISSAISSECCLSVICVIRLASPTVFSASARAMFTTSGAYTYPFSNCPRFEWNKSANLITPVTSNTINTHTAAAATPDVIFNQIGHLPISIFFKWILFRLTSRSLNKSASRSSAVCVRSSMRIFKAFIIAFSLFFGILTPSLDGGSNVSLLRRSIASSGVTPVIILYNVAAQAYTSVHVP